MQTEIQTSATSEKPVENCHLRYKHLKSTIRQLVLENAALTSEIENTDAQLISAKQERKVLLKRLMQYEKPDGKSAKAHRKSANGLKKNMKQEAELDDRGITLPAQPSADQQVPTENAEAKCVDSL